MSTTVHINFGATSSNRSGGQHGPTYTTPTAQGMVDAKAAAARTPVPPSTSVDATTCPTLSPSIVSSAVCCKVCGVLPATRSRRVILCFVQVLHVAQQALGRSARTLCSVHVEAALEQYSHNCTGLSKPVVFPVSTRGRSTARSRQAYTLIVGTESEDLGSAAVEQAPCLIVVALSADFNIVNTPSVVPLPSEVRDIALYERPGGPPVGAVLACGSRLVLFDAAKMELTGTSRCPVRVCSLGSTRAFTPTRTPPSAHWRYSRNNSASHQPLAHRFRRYLRAPTL